MSSPTDEQLLDAHIRGDMSAFRLLVERHHRELFGFVVRFTGSRPAAEDVVQDAFLQVHMAAASFDPERKLKPWLFTIAANKARDYLRSRTRRKEIPLDSPINASEDFDGQRFSALIADEGPAPSENLEEAEQSAIVRKVVDQMPSALREVLTLAYFQSFSYKELADILGIPLGTVKSRLHSAVATFAKRFREEQNRREGTDV
ncbi:MAG: RNA polymerase sigma factor [Planctomycetota bacterium]